MCLVDMRGANEAAIGTNMCVRDIQYCWTALMSVQRIMLTVPQKQTANRNFPSTVFASHRLSKPQNCYSGENTSSFHENTVGLF